MKQKAVVEFEPRPKPTADEVIMRLHTLSQEQSNKIDDLRGIVEEQARRISELESTIAKMDAMANNDGYAESLSSLVDHSSDDDVNAEQLTPVHVDENGTIWAIEIDNKTGWRGLYASEKFGTPFVSAGDIECGIPADVPKVVADVFWPIR